MARVGKTGGASMPHARARGGPGPPVTLLLSAWRWNGRLTGRGPNRYVAIGASCPCLGRCCRRDRPRSNCSCRSGVTLRLSFHWALPLGFPSLRRDHQSLSHDRLGRRSARAQPTDCLAVRSTGVQNTSSWVLSSHPHRLSGRTETILALVRAGAAGPRHELARPGLVPKPSMV